MNKLLNAANASIRAFVRDEDGAQVVEYALVIAVVSIALVIALKALATGNAISTFVSRVGTCLSGGACAANP